MRNLMVTGGSFTGPAFHPFERTSALLSGFLDDLGIASTVTDDVEGGLAALDAYDLLTWNALRWRMIGDMFDADRETWGMSLSNAGRDALAAHLARGGGILALHTAAVCFDDWPGWGDIVGAHWNWERSSHPEPRPTKIAVSAVAHPIVAGLGDFEVTDELYSFLDYRPDVVPLVTASRHGADQPLLWAREVGGGRVVYDALGHDERSLGHPTHRTILRRAALWALSRPDADVAAA
jgi:hypothetical protein